MSNVITDVAEMINQENKEWLSIFLIPSLLIHSSKTNPLDYLYRLCRLLFPEYPPMEEPEDEDININVVKAKYLKDLFFYFGIEGIDHWSPLTKITQQRTREMQLAGLEVFNQVMENIHYYLTLNQTFISQLKRNLHSRLMQSEKNVGKISKLAHERNSLRSKYERIIELINKCEDEDLKEEIYTALDN